MNATTNGSAGPAAMNTVLGFFLAVCAIVGALITGVVMLSAGLFFRLHPTPWNFPGDPPIFDLMFFAAAFAAGVNLPIAVLVARSERPRGLIVLLSHISAGMAAILFIASAAGILERHDSRWREIRNGIRQYGDAIAAATGDKNRVLTHDEFRRFHDRFMPQPIPIVLRGYGVVHLRMAHGVYPYVGVDFGGGANALFDPRTMFCTYSD
jgi:hypothetical protein